MNKTVIAFQRGFITSKEPIVKDLPLAMTIQAELMNLGYMLDYDAFSNFSEWDKSDVEQFGDEIIPYIKEMLGGLRDYKPVYPGFPQQVMEMTEAELWLNQFIGYMTGGTFSADEYPTNPQKAFEHVEYKMITLKSEEDFNQILPDLLSVNQSLTPTDTKTIEWFIKSHHTLIFPNVIPFKENLAVVLGMFLKLGRGIEHFTSRLTTTDVLRVAMYLSNGKSDLMSLPPKKVKAYGGWKDNPKRKEHYFRKFSRKERRFILELLEHSNCNIQEMKLYQGRWIRLGEILHPGEYKGKYPIAYDRFNVLRNYKVRSWYSSLVEGFNVSLEIGLKILTERPGEFLRRVDWLLRAYPKSQQLILEILYEMALLSSNKVIFELYTHFGNRLVEKPRSIVVKGARKRIPLKTLNPFSRELVEEVQSTLISAFKEKLKELPPMGKCWVSEDLKYIPMPTNMRSVSEGIVPIIRGQKIPLTQGKDVLRAYVHWFDERGTMDIDLHVHILSDTYKHLDSFGYNSSKSESYGCYSGDVRHRQGACAEYVDIIPSKLPKDAKYIIITPHNYSGLSFKDTPEGIVGVMERESSGSNKHWLPESVTNSIRLMSNSRTIISGIIDVKEMVYIHMDYDIGTSSDYMGSSLLNEITQVIIPSIEGRQIAVYDLLTWHIEARGIPSSKESADTHFLIEDFATNYVNILKYLGV